MNPLESRIELEDIARQIVNKDEFQSGKMATILANKVLGYFNPSHVTRARDLSEKRIGIGYSFCKICGKETYDPVLLRCNERHLHQKLYNNPSDLLSNQKRGPYNMR